MPSWPPGRLLTDWMLSLNGVDIRVEVKNAKQHHESWITKFKRDMQATKAHAGLYLSLQDTTCSTRSPFQFDTSPVPLLFIHGVEQYPLASFSTSSAAFQQHSG
jgi:hypothetical protein